MAFAVLGFVLHVLFSPWLLVAVAIVAWIKFRPSRSASVAASLRLPHRDREKPPQPGNVRMLLEVYGVMNAERNGLIQLVTEAC